jgi:hypothetical protein
MRWLVDLPRYRLRIKVVLASVIFFGMTGVKTYPLILHVSTHIPTNLGDPLLNVWILTWDFHALTTKPWSVFHANIFYPVHNTLAFSEHLLGVQPLFGPIYALTGNPIVAYNVVFSLSFVLSGIAMFLLVHYWTRSFWAALVSGFLFAFTPIRFGQIDHLQLLNFYWAPIALLFFERFLRRTRWRDLVGFSAFYWLQVLSSVYLGWFITIAVALYALYYTWRIDRHLLSGSMIPRYTTLVVFTLLILLAIHFPYYQAKQQWGFSRSLEECVFYSADLVLSYATIPSFLNDVYLPLFRLASKLRSYERTLFPGFAFPFLIILAGIPRRGLFLPAGLRQMKQTYGLLLIAGFILSLGPSLIMLDRNLHIPLPYLWLYYLAPGFQAMRVPARFGLMVMLAASVLAAFGFLQACNSVTVRLGSHRASPRTYQAVLALTCLGLFMLELGCKPLPLAQIQTGDEIPDVYRWLAAEKPGPILEVPLGRGEDCQ